MADERSGMSNSQVTVALIGAAAVIGSAVIANSDRIFGQPHSVQPLPTPSPTATGPVANNVIAPSPAPTVVPPAAPEIIPIAGAWRGEDGSVWEFAQEGDRFGGEKTEGVERVRIEGQVSGQAVRIWVDYYQATSGNLGLRIMNCEGQVASSGEQMQLSCLNPQTNVTSRASWTKV